MCAEHWPTSDLPGEEIPRHGLAASSAVDRDYAIMVAAAVASFFVIREYGQT